MSKFKAMTLSDALAVRGWTTQPGAYGRKRVYGADGALLGEWTASETWAALRQTGQAIGLIGQWPGDESDEVIAKALKEIE